MNKDFSLIEQSYLLWKRSPENTRHSSFKLHKIDLTLIFFRGRAIHSKNGWTPGVIPDRIYITSTDNERIKEIFNKVVESDSVGTPRQISMYHFINNRDNLFELHYYPNVEAIRTNITETENKFTPKQERSKSCALS